MSKRARRILVVGNGAREHALCWKLRPSRELEALYCAPGNPGTALVARNVPIKVDDLAGLSEFCTREKIDLAIIGPEYPLSLGLADELNAQGIPTFGPSREAAQLESSKSFAKDIMIRAKVPTARYEVVTTLAEAKVNLAAAKLPLVLKADGLAAGKGVYICHTRAEIDAALPVLFTELKSDRVVIEEFLEGVEASLIIATNGKDIVTLAPAHDYKRIGDGDTGLNTGGMGTVSPTSHLTSAQADETVARVIRPVLQEMAAQGVPFVGFLFAGLMISPAGEIRVLEFNARMGDPETQVIMARLESDLVELLSGLLGLGEPISTPRWRKETAVCVVLASDGYPGEIRKGDVITGQELATSLPDLYVFHAGTALSPQGELVTAGGRVLSVVGLGSDLEAARGRAYRGVDLIQFRGRQVRRDIGRS